ncbi:MAG: hypothetical protein AAFY15_14380 [Cyanobacteria bacterium J06648_11]
MKVKIGDEVFELRGEDGNFPIPSELADALATAPEGQAKMRIVIEDQGDAIDNDIGSGTVQAWRTVYGTTDIASF